MRSIFLIFLIIALILLGFYVFQRKLIYFPDMRFSTPRQERLKNMQVIELKTADNLILRAWYQKAEKGLPTILYLHGNAGNIGMRAPIIKPYLDAGYGVLLLSYRGYSGNPGTPTEQNLYKDARSAIRYLQLHGVQTPCIVLFGESLGAGVALQMAMEYPVAAMILVSAFTSVVDVAGIHYPYLPARWFAKDRYDNLSKIKQTQQPLLILHGVRDRIIPVWMAERLYLRASGDKKIIKYPNAGHNGIMTAQFFTDVLKFLEKIRPAC